MRCEILYPLESLKRGDLYLPYFSHGFFALSLRIDDGEEKFISFSGQGGIQIKTRPYDCATSSNEYFRKASK